MLYSLKLTTDICCTLYVIEYGINQSEICCASGSEELGVTYVLLLKQGDIHTNQPTVGIRCIQPLMFSH